MVSISTAFLYYQHLIFPKRFPWSRNAAVQHEVCYYPIRLGQITRTFSVGDTVQTTNQNNAGQKIVSASITDNDLSALWSNNQVTINGNLLKQLKLDTARVCNTTADKPEKCIDAAIAKDNKYDETSITLSYTGIKPSGFCADTKPGTAAGAKGDILCLALLK